jgi:hypothetical protein
VRYQDFGLATSPAFAAAVKNATDVSVKAWASLLTVDRIPAPALAFDRSCTKMDVGGGWWRYASTKRPGRYYFYNKETRETQWAWPAGVPPLVDGICYRFGPPVLPTEYRAHTVPDSWLKAAKAASGCARCGDNASECCLPGQSGAIDYPAGEGVAEADFAVVVTINQSTSCGAPAWGQILVRDQYDRPTLGAINWCPDSWGNGLKFSVGGLTAQTLSTAKHELGHVLGFSATSLPLMRINTTGTPRTARDPTTGLPPIREVTCMDGDVQVLCLSVLA